MGIVLEDGLIWKWISTCRVQGLAILSSDQVRLAEQLGDTVHLLVHLCTLLQHCVLSWLKSFWKLA